MMSTPTEDKFTVQGADPPVPVGDAGEIAGPAQPSASDCSVPSVGNQAEGDIRETGRDTGEMEALGPPVDDQDEARGMATGEGREKETPDVGQLLSFSQQQDELKAFGRSPKIARSPVRPKINLCPREGRTTEREIASGNTQQSGDRSAEAGWTEIGDEIEGYTSGYQENSGLTGDGKIGTVKASEERTGSPQPSSSECSEFLADDQAGARSMAAGKKNVKEMSAMRPEMERKMVACFSAMTGAAGSCRDLTMGAKLKRKFGKDVGGSRTWGSAPSSPHNSVLDLTMDEDEAKLNPKKKATGDKTPSYDRPRQEESGELASKVRDTIKRIDKEVRAVVDAAKERNTKKEVKEAALALRKLLSTMMSGEVQELLQSLGKSVEERDKPSLEKLNLVARLEALEGRTRKLEDSNRALREENIYLKAELGKPRPADKEMASRLARLEWELKDLKVNNRTLKEENAKLRSEINDREEGMEIVTHEHIKACNNNEAWQKLEKLRWPGKIFTAVFLVNDSPLRSNVDADLLLWDEDGPEAECNRELREHFNERFPELTYASDDLLAATVCTTFKDGQGEIKTNVRHIFRMSTGDGCYDSMVRMRDIMIDKGREKLAVYPPGSDPLGSQMKKLLECIFKDSPVKCLLYRRGGTGTGSKRSITERSEALVVRQEGASYAELLRTVKAKVRPNSEAASAIRTIRESRDGGMVIVLSEQGTERKHSLLREMADLDGVTVKQARKNRETAMNITDIGHDVTEDEILGALARELGLGVDEMSLSGMRPAFGGNRATTVRLPKEAAEQMVKKGGLRIGLNWCPARIRVDVTRCFRCWQFGHIGRECRAEEDGSKLCRRCGGTDHQARNCNGTVKCLTCKQAGHFAGSGRCPEFRKALDRARQRANKRKKS